MEFTVYYIPALGLQDKEDIVPPKALAAFNTLADSNAFANMKADVLLSDERIIVVKGSLDGTYRGRKKR